VAVDVKVTDGTQTATSAASIPASPPAGPPRESPQKEGPDHKPPKREPDKQPHPALGAVVDRIPEHVAAMLTYLLGWVSGVIFLLVDRRPFVRYHAAQSVIVFTTLTVVFLFLGNFFLATFFHGEHIQEILLALRRIVELVWVVATVVLMVKASSGERYRVPYAAKHAERAARSVAPVDETRRDMRHSAT
jgi:uncharacterized membrane protein